MLPLLLGNMFMLTISGCKELTGSQPLPAGTSSPSAYRNKAGALGMRVQAIYTLEQALPQYLVDAGLLTDELTYVSRSSSASVIGAPVGDPNGRNLPAPVLGHIIDRHEHSYESLQSVRGYISQALSALAAYDTAAADTATASTLRGELYALEGYSDILLADLFCSGVPLSTLDFERDYTYHASSTTANVYQTAVAKADSALALLSRASADDTLLNLARVVRGRALLDLGDYAHAAQAVASVPTPFTYRLAIQWTKPTDATSLWVANNITVADTEGFNGLPFISDGDARTSVSVLIPSCPTCDPPTFLETLPAKYDIIGFSDFPVATGIEARLIQAEAAYHGVATGQGSWLDQLNALRQTAIAPALPNLSDPGSDSARVALFFKERAYWLFVTGHRQGDLRRLLREYKQWYVLQREVYPSGIGYGNDVTVPIPGTEYINPFFHGCLDRDP